MAPEIWILVATSSSILLGIPVVILIIDWWDPLGVERRVKDLEDAVQTVGQIHDGLDLHLHPSQRRKGWVRRVRRLHVKSEMINSGHRGCGLNYLSKCYYGKQADKELKKAIDLIDTGKELLEEAQARPRRPRNQLWWGLDSYKHQVLHFMESSRGGLLGIWGMAGVGKTSLLELVLDSFAERAPSFFDHVVLVRVGRGGGGRLVKMRKDISASMVVDGNYSDDTETIISRYLANRSFLLLIDDLREFDDLTKIGIPMPLGLVRGRDRNRKVVFTMRNVEDVIKLEHRVHIFRSLCLSEHDAWNLFMDKLGNVDAWNLFMDKLGNDEIITDSAAVRSLAGQVVYQCGGLPMALCTMAQAMSTKQDPKEWSRAVDLLKDSELRTIIRNDLNLHDIVSNLNLLKELRKDTDDDLVDTSMEELLKAVLALRVVLAPASKRRVTDYIQLREIDLPYLHGMASYRTMVLDFVEDGGTGTTWSSSPLGTWGVRGVGKTTLLRFVWEYGHDFSSCDTFFVGAGPESECTVAELQHALCVSIGLDPLPHHMSGSGDVDRLKKLISSSLEGTPFLLLLDDVRERIDLAALGVPMPLGRNQKVIFTARNEAICNVMGCSYKATIHMKCLGQDDAWRVFNDKVGDEIIDGHPHIRHLADKMVAACHGLPSVLCALGRAMSTKRDVKEWRYAHDVLLQRMPPQDEAPYSHLHHMEDALLERSFF